MRTDGLGPLLPLLHSFQGGYHLIFEKGLFTDEEFYERLKEVDLQYKAGKRNPPMIAKIMPRGQTGADRVALDVAIEEGIFHGGRILKGRKTEAGPLPEEYQMKEMPNTKRLRETKGKAIFTCWGRLDKSCHVIDVPGYLLSLQKNRQIVIPEPLPIRS